jgi:hypothetical protein
MSKVRVHISVSADGYVAGPNQSLENPLGEGGEELHEWLLGLRAWREPHGLEGGLDQARTAAAGKDVAIGGGASVINRYLAAGSSTSSSCMSFRWCWAAARGSSRASARNSSSNRFGRSRRPE